MASNACPPQEHDPIYGSRKLHVTLLASEWGSSKGALSTINRELAIQLAKFPYIKVTFFLPKCSDEDKKAAESHHITILEAKRRPGFNELDWLSFPPRDLRIDVVVGHGVELGHQVQAIRDSHKCKWVQVVHTDSEAIGMFKPSIKNAISKEEKKHKIEVELCTMADFVVGVGPRLTEAFNTYLSFWNKAVFQFTPGVFDDFADVQLTTVKRKHPSVLVFGHGDADDFELKGFDIAARSVAALPDAHLIFVGVQARKQQETANRFLGFGIPRHRLRVKSYVNSREHLRQLFCEVDLVLMPSRAEGFGLIGLEALSAGLPMIISKKSGFGEALCSLKFGPSFVIDSEDPKAWTAAIEVIWKRDRRSQLDEVNDMRDIYKKRYSWSEQCKGLIEEMFKLIEGRSYIYLPLAFCSKC